MKDEESQSSSSSSGEKRQELSTSSSSGVFKFNQRGGYKLWAVGAILLLAFWSMFTGSVTLKWTSLNNPLSDSLLHHHHNLDILEVEEREKLVRRLWDVYTHSSTIRLPRFWQEAFEAAYEHLISDASPVRDAAVSEIAKMSLLSLDDDVVDSPPAHSHPSSTRETRQTKNQDEKAMETAARARRLPDVV